MEGGLMASSTDSFSNLNLEQQRKRAKDLRRAHRNGVLEAGVRVSRYLPRVRHFPVQKVLESPLTLAEAQFIVAREAGFASWPKMKHHIEEANETQADIAEALIDAAFAGNENEVGRLRMRVQYSDRCRRIRRKRTSRVDGVTGLRCFICVVADIGATTVNSPKCDARSFSA
jgi:hypothetical protein